MKRIFILVEYRKNTISSTSKAVINMAGLLRQKTDAHVTCILFGTVGQPVIQYLNDLFLDVVVLNPDMAFNDSAKANIHDAYQAYFKSEKPDYVLAAHNDFGLNLIPYLGGALNGSVVTGIDNLIDASEASIVVQKPSFFGRLRSEVEASLPAYLTVSPCQLPSYSAPGKECRVTTVNIDLKREFFTFEGTENTALKDTALDASKIVVAVGRGIGSEENLKRMKSYIDQIPGAVMAGSRPVIDAGWMPYPFQVGITGKQIEPDLYLALGISGSSQHLAGIVNSKTVIAVNTDASAPIFSHSDYCIQSDMFAFMEAFTALFSEK